MSPPATRAASGTCRKAHGGLLSTINRGLAEASGELISFLSADDMWVPAEDLPPGRLPVRAPAVGLVHSDMEVVDDHGTVVHPRSSRRFGCRPSRARSCRCCCSETSSRAVPRWCGRACSAGSSRSSSRVAAWEDWWIAFHVAQVAGIGLIREPLYRYRRHGDNMNLGSAGISCSRSCATELPFRRFMLTSIAAGAVTPGELLAGYNAFIQLAQHVSQTLAEPIESVLPVDDHHRAAARGPDRLVRQQHAARGRGRAWRRATSSPRLAHNPMGRRRRDADPRPRRRSRT